MTKSNRITIPAIRRLTGAALLPDCTLVQWFEVITDDDTRNTIRREIEVTESYAVTLAVYGIEDLSERSKVFLDIDCRFPEDRGWIKLLKGASVVIQACHTSESGRTLEALGVATGHVRIQRKDFGCITVPTIQGFSNKLWPRTAEWDIPDFKSIVEGGYHGQKPVKVNGKSV